MRSSKLFSAVLMAALVLLVSACNRAPNNVITMQTTDCGRNWTVVDVGEKIPKNTMNVCGYNIQLPNYPMQGGSEFRTQFKDNVLVKVQITYDYQIVDGRRYLNYAKFLGKMREDTTGGEEANSENGTSQYETAENVVIDNRMRELVTEATKDDDIVMFNPSNFETELFREANEVLNERGVQLNSMTFVTLPEDQTRMAIDAATAMAVYRSKGMEQLGYQLVVARAGATQVSVNSTDKN